MVFDIADYPCVVICISSEVKQFVCVPYCHFPKKRTFDMIQFFSSSLAPLCLYVFVVEIIHLVLTYSSSVDLNCFSRWQS